MVRDTSHSSPEQAGYDAVASPSRTVPVLVLYRDNGINKNIYSGKLIDSAADKAALEAWIGANSRPYLYIFALKVDRNLTQRIN